MKRVVLALLLAPAVAFATGKHPSPKPQPVQAPKRCSCWWQPVLAGVGVTALVGVPIYLSRKEDGQEKRVEIQPTEDGKGAKVAFQWRH